MAQVNKAFYIGNLTRDLEVKEFESGDKVGNTAVAVNESYKLKDGTKKEVVTFVNLYEKDGHKHLAHSVRVEDYQMLDPKPAGE